MMTVPSISEFYCWEDLMEGILSGVDKNKWSPYYNWQARPSLHIIQKRILTISPSSGLTSSTLDKREKRMRIWKDKATRGQEMWSTKWSATYSSIQKQNEFSSQIFGSWSNFAASVFRGRPAHPAHYGASCSAVSFNNAELISSRLQPVNLLMFTAIYGYRDQFFICAEMV